MSFYFIARIFLLFLIEYICYYFGNSFIIVFSSIIIIYILLSILGIVGTPIIFQKYLSHGICYLKEYTSSDSSYSYIFGKMNDLISKNKAKFLNYSLIAIYKNESGTFEEKKLKYIGFYRTINYKMDEDIKIYEDEFLKKMEFEMYTIPEIRCLFSSWSYDNILSKTLGIKKFYNLIKKKLSDDNFKTAFKVNLNEIKGSFELYDELLYNSNIDFYIPLTKAFQLYKNDKIIEI